MTTAAEYRERAQNVVAMADEAGRPLTQREIDRANQLLLKAKTAELGAAMAFEPENPGGRPSTGSLYDAMMDGGFDRRSRPSVDVPFSVFGGPRFRAAASFSGSFDTANPAFKDGPALGADRRFLFTQFPRESVARDETSVSTFRQTSRTPPVDLSTVVRALAATSEKPAADTATELVNAPLKQIAITEQGVPNAYLESDRFRSWINTDLAHTFNSAIDAHAIAAIATANPASGGVGLDFLTEVLYAAETVMAQGYSPNVVVASPLTLIDGLVLAKQPDSGGGYIFGATGQLPLDGLSRVAVSGLATPMVMDTRAAGTLYITDARLETFEENSGQTNTSTVRLEANGVFVVQRVAAIAEAVVGS